MLSKLIIGIGCLGLTLTVTGLRLGRRPGGFQAFFTGYFILTVGALVLIIWYYF